MCDFPQLTILFFIVFVNYTVNSKYLAK